MPANNLIAQFLIKLRGLKIVRVQHDLPAAARQRFLLGRQK